MKKSVKPNLDNNQVDGLKCPWTVELCEIFQEFLKLEKGWDGYDGKVISESTISSVISLLTQLYQPKIKPPSVAPNSEGSMIMDWFFSDFEITICVDVDGEVEGCLKNLRYSLGDSRRYDECGGKSIENCMTQMKEWFSMISDKKDYSGQDLRDSNLPKNLEHAKLDKTILTGMDLSNSDLRKANLHKSDLSKANLSRANLTDADLSGANLSGVDLSEANLTDADLSGANLTDADLETTHLIGTNLSKSNLQRAKLELANLANANLNEADLRGAQLKMANFSGADFTRANLASAKLDNAYGKVKLKNLSVELVEIEDLEKWIKGSAIAQAFLLETER